MTVFAEIAEFHDLEAKRYAAIADNWRKSAAKALAADDTFAAERYAGCGQTALDIGQMHDRFAEAARRTNAGELVISGQFFTDRPSPSARTLERFRA